MSDPSNLALRHDDLDITATERREPSPVTPVSTPKASFARDAALIARQAAEALDCAHASDILHRDINRRT
jgi:eukaryotic-like serine/threonine-protein kinase